MANVVVRDDFHSYYAKTFAASSIASMCANVFTHPLETIKVRQVLEGKSFGCAARCIAHEGGFKAFYNGFNAALVRAVISGGGRLTGYHSLRSAAELHGMLTPRERNGGRSAASIKEVPIRAAIATLAACSAQWLAAPADLVRTRQAAWRSNASRPPTMLAVGRQVKAEGGIKALWSGSSALMGRAASFNIAQLLSYDAGKDFAIASLGKEPDHVATHVVAALFAGVFATAASAPFENIKTHAQAHRGTTSKYINQSIALNLFKAHGVRGFYRGSFSLYLKIAPHTAVVFLVLEQLRNALSLPAI